MVAKYDPLFEHLCRSGDGPLEMSFDDIERLVGELPASASRSTAWWTNQPEGRNVQARAWSNAGRDVVRVDLAARQVTFGPATWRRGA